MFTPQFVNNLSVQIWQMSSWMWYRSSGGSNGGGASQHVPPHGLKYSHFHAFLGKIWLNSMLAPPLPEGWCPLLWGILEPPLLHPCGGWGWCCLTHMRAGEILNTPLLIHLNSSGLSIYYLATKTHTLHENNVELPPPRGKSWILDPPLNRNNYLNILLFKNKSNEIGKQSSIKFQGLPHINWLKCSKQSAYYRVNLCATAFPLCWACPGTLPRSCQTKLVIMPKVSFH